MRRTYASATRITAALALPLCLGTAAIAPRLVPLVYGDAFCEAIPVAVLLCCTGAVGASAAAGSALLYAMERSRFVLLSGVCGAALAVTGFALVVPHTGALGAAATRGAVQVSMVGVGTWYIARRLRGTSRAEEFHDPTTRIVRQISSTCGSGSLPLFARTMPVTMREDS